MADGVDITAGAGTTVATDEITTVNGGAVAARHAQRVKIDSLGTDGAFTDTSKANPFPTRSYDATDVGRVTRHFLMDNYVAAPVADTLMSVTQFYNNALVAGTTQPAVVPAGKALRLTGMRLSTKSLAAAGSVVLRIRFNTAGLVVIGSPIVKTLEVGSVAAVAGLLSESVIAFPEGVDLPAAGGIGFSLAGYNATGTLTLQGVTRFEVWGYEYTV